MTYQPALHSSGEKSFSNKFALKQPFFFVEKWSQKIPKMPFATFFGLTVFTSGQAASGANHKFLFTESMSSWTRLDFPEFLARAG